MAANAVQEAPAAANTDMVSLQLSLPQMLDLALGTPEVGVVNFNILHNFLHVLLHQINLRTTKVEYRGEHADRIKTMVTSSKPEPTLQLHEYSITDGTGKVLQRVREDDGLEVEVFTEGTPLDTVDRVKVTKGVRQQVSPEKEGEAETVIFVEPAINGVLPTAVAFKELEQSVKQLQQQYQALQDLTGTPEVVERLKGRLTDPVADIWHFININKRLDASEQGIDKLTTMIQDVLKGEKGENGIVAMMDATLIDTRLTELKDKILKIEQRCTCNLQEITELWTEDVSPAVYANLTAVNTVKAAEVMAAEAAEVIEAEAAEVIETEAAEEEPTVAKAAPVAPAIVRKVATYEETVPAREKEEMAKEVPRPDKPIDRPVVANQKRIADDVGLTELRQDVATLKTDVARMQEELDDLKETVSRIESPVTRVVKKPAKKPVETVEGMEVVETVEGVEAVETVADVNAVKTVEAAEAPPTLGKPFAAEAIADLERTIERNDVTNVEQCMEVVKSLATTHGEVLHKVTEDMAVLDNQMNQLSEKLDDIQATDKARDSDINKLYSKMQNIQLDVEKFEQFVDKQLDDKEKQETNINELMDQIEVLKTVKADREDLEDALADKADAQAVKRKVSHDQFDAACEDLARGLGEAIDKLTKQELIWQQALDEVQNEIAGKADRGEMTPLKDFVNKKLKSLQEKLKSMIEAKREIEAAGTKKLLRDVQCISCDKDVVMKTEEIGKFHTEPLPCTTSMRPYLTYELDQVRKQQRRLPHSRNMIQLEAAMQEEAKKIKTAREETPRDHLCNRYCGGSHTVTTPQQRVTRMGHFLSQWGPEVVQLTDGWIRGKDGRMYRSRLVPGKLDVCEPACWESQSSEDARPTECATSASTPLRKALQSRRNNPGSQKRTSKRHSDNSKEPKISEPVVKPVVEVRQKPSTPETIDYSLIAPPIPAQDEIVLFETEETLEE